MVVIQFNFAKSKYKNLVKLYIDKKMLSRYIKKVCGNRNVVFQYNFVTSNEQIALNKEFKAHDYNTDILTFDMSENDCELTGDVYISLRQVEKNAKRYGVDMREEINRVIIHGFLHILGYNDETKNEKKVMRKEENKYLKYLSKKCSTWNSSV